MEGCDPSDWRQKWYFLRVAAQDDFPIHRIMSVDNGYYVEMDGPDVMVTFYDEPFEDKQWFFGLRNDFFDMVAWK